MMLGPIYLSESTLNLLRKWWAKVKSNAKHARYALDRWQDDGGK